MNLIICGCSGAGKSTAIRRLLRKIEEPLYGFWTEKLAPDPDGRCPVYIHGCREPLTFTKDHLIGTCCNQCAEKFPESFDEVGVRYLSDIPEASLVLMDEIGFMENDAQKFIEAIFRILDGNYRVIAAVRDRETKLLNAVRQHPKSYCVAAKDAHTETLLQYLSK